MMTIGLQSTTALAAFVLAAFLSLSQAPAAIGQQSVRCFEDWSDAAPIVLKEKLLPVGDIQAWARKRLKGNVIRVTLCQDGDRYTYRVLVREPKGRIRNRIVEARGPLDQPDPPKASKPPKKK